ncbi:putative signal peptide-containing protein [Cryptosporidium canis]|uniref:Signal peptide-containing protein n=1 Tax=Cryptosporidium canis TaxID=195482 RepID=A0A9D5HZ27_9CRYT|nr:putative signal peptide-containing protein [Cryptosporidium canis]
MLRLFYQNSKTLLKTVYFIPLEGGWISVLISVLGSLILFPVLTVGILTTHLFKLFDLVWIRLSYLWCRERHLLLEPLNDVDYLMWRSNFFGQTLIMCFFVTDSVPTDQVEKYLVWRIENKDAFQDSAEDFPPEFQTPGAKYTSLPNSLRKNKRLFCKVESSLGRLWFKYAGDRYDTSKNIIKLTPVHARMILSRPELVMDKDSPKNLAERISDLEKACETEFSSTSLSEDEVKDLYSLLFNCEDLQLSIERPCWRIILVDNAIWNGNHSSILIGQFHHVIGDGSTLTEFVKRTVLDNAETSRVKRESIKGVTRSARFWHQWVSGLLWAAIAGPITLLKAALQARPERSWDAPSKRRSSRSNRISSAGPINLSLDDVNLVKDKLNEELNSRQVLPDLSTNDQNTSTDGSASLFDHSKEKPKLVQRRGYQNLAGDARKGVQTNNGESHKFSKRITFNDIILSCIASGYSKYVNHYISAPEIHDSTSNSSTSAHSPVSSIAKTSPQTLAQLQTLSTPSSRRNGDQNKESGSQSISPFHFDDKSPYSSVLKYDSISSSQDFDGELDVHLKPQMKAKINAVYSGSCSPCKENDLSLLCHSNLNVVVTTNNRVSSPTKLDNAFSTIVLPIPTCPLASPSERLRCVFESLQEYRKTSLPIIFIRYIQYTLSLSPYALLCLWRPHSKSCSMYYSSVPGPKSCSFMNKRIRDMTFALPLTDHIGLGVSVFSFDDKVSVSCTFDEEIILNPSLLLESIKLSFEELKSGVLAKI